MALNRILRCTFLALLLLVTTTRGGDVDAAVEKKLAQIPSPAAAALKAAAGPAHIERVTLEKEGTLTVYEVHLTEPGKADREISVRADGTINAEEETVSLESVPELARKAIVDGAKTAVIQRVQKIKRSTGTTYEALYVTKGRKSEVEYMEDGKLKPEAK